MNPEGWAIANVGGFTLRPATKSEDGPIRRLIQQAQINPVGLEWRHFVIATDDRGQIVGCGQIKEHRGGVRELASVVVVPDWRGRGVAGAIIQRLKEQAGPPLWLMCRSGLVPLYARFGFDLVAPDEPQPAYYRRMRALAKAFVFAGRQDHLAIMSWRED